MERAVHFGQTCNFASLEGDDYTERRGAQERDGCSMTSYLNVLPE